MSKGNKGLCAGRYEILRERIGKGRQGTVYMGRHMDTNERVAVKAVKRTGKSSDLQEVKELLRLQQFGHPHIIRLLDQQRSDTHLVMVMEYCEGGTLEDYLRRHGRMRENDARRVFAQIVSGLVFLQEHNVIHRDLKPQNILLTSSNIQEAMVRIADMGFAKSRPYDMNPMFESVNGTPMYMAPERVAMTPYDFKSEVWAAGVILYQLLFGAPPFEEASTPAELAKLQRSPLVIPSTPPTSEECKGLLSSMLKVLPQERPTIADVHAHEWLGHRTVAVATSPMRPPRVMPVVEPFTSPTQDAAADPVDAVPSPAEDAPRECPSFAPLGAVEAARLVAFCADTFPLFRCAHRAALYCYAASFCRVEEDASLRQSLLQGARGLLAAASESCSPSPKDLLVYYASRTCRDVAMDEYLGQPPTDDMRRAYTRCGALLKLVLYEGVAPSSAPKVEQLHGLLAGRPHCPMSHVVDAIGAYHPSATSTM